MALTNYSGLSTGVFSRLNRAADSTVFDNCISLAEAEINRRLALKPVRPMHTVATATINAEFIGVPSGILDVDSLYVDSLDWEIEATSPQNITAMKEREEVERTDLEILLGSNNTPPKFYAQVGSEFRFYPAPLTSYTATMIYWARVPNLNSTDSTNWLLTDHPDVYFHGVLAHAYQEYFDPENADNQAALFDTALEKVLSAYPSRPDSRPLRSEISRRSLTTRFGWYS